MNLDIIIKQLDLQLLTPIKSEEPVIAKCGYASDLLSCVLAGAKSGAVWITLQSHVNVVAVAAMLDLCAVVLTEDVHPDPDTLSRAEEQGVILLSTPKGSYEVSGELWKLGLPTS